MNVFDGAAMLIGNMFEACVPVIVKGVVVSPQETQVLAPPRYEVFSAHAPDLYIILQDAWQGYLLGCVCQIDGWNVGVLLYESTDFPVVIWRGEHDQRTIAFPAMGDLSGVKVLGVEDPSGCMCEAADAI